MLPLSQKAGSDIVCIDKHDGSGGLPPLVVGNVYVFSGFSDGCEPRYAGDDEFGVAIDGVDHETPRRSRWWNFFERRHKWFYCRECFRPLNLAGLDILLNTQIQKEDA